MKTDEERGIRDEYDQYTNYDRLPVLLKRFSFDEKMRIAAEHSNQSLTRDQYLSQIDRSITLPWCIETFVKLAVEAKEYNSRDFKGENQEWFIKMYNAIWGATSYIINQPREEFTFADIFMAVTGLSQFYFQESAMIFQYRYWKLFNDNSEPTLLRDVFKRKMGTEYEDYMVFGTVLYCILFAKYHDKQIDSTNAINYLILQKYRKVSDNLTITRNDYIELQRKYANGIEDVYRYIYSLSPSYRFTFIQENDKLYLPLPHLITMNTTSALLYRLTEGDDALRNSLGKNVLEKYVFSIVKNASVYDEVFAEQEYENNGNRELSPDVLARIGTEILFLDSKSTVPSTGIRIADLNAFRRKIDIVSSNIKKLYKQILKFEKYNPFKLKENINRENYWGIVIVFEDSYIRREHYFRVACEKLKIGADSEEGIWIKNHIKVVSLYEIERVCLSNCSLIAACKEGYKKDPFNFTFADFPRPSENKENTDYVEFKNMLHDKTSKVFQELFDNGMLK